MGYPLRPLAAQCTYHVTTRGVDRQDIFRSDDDRAVFLRLLDRSVRERGWELLAYCLMGNHLHLVLTTPEPDLDSGMRDLLARYALYFNRTHGRSGHLFGRRYHSVVVEDDRQLMATIRYVGRNPVAAGLVRSPEDWRWSSYAGLMGTSSPVPSLATSKVLRLFHASPQRARRLMRNLVDIDERLVARAGRNVTPAMQSLVEALGQKRAMGAADDFGSLHRVIAEALGAKRSAITQTLARRVTRNL